jgi:hypothetical protein
MQSILLVLIPIAVVAVFVVLMAGVLSMSRGGAENSRRSNSLMRLRVLMQLIAVLLIVAFFLISKP